MHILVVDDNVDLADTMALILQADLPAPVTIDVGYDGAQGVFLAAANRPQVVIMDIDMPIMNGMTAAKAIRAASASNPPLLVAVTGNDTHASLEAQQGPFDHILIKPIDFEALLRVVADEAGG